MKSNINRTLVLLLAVVLSIAMTKSGEDKKMELVQERLIRIAELEIEEDYLEAYLSILQREAEASIRLEPGVICIYPMYQKDQVSKIRLLEIYASEQAYQSHLKTEHFLHYKTSTAHMVKSLKLIDMQAVDPETMSKIFRRLD